MKKIISLLLIAVMLFALSSSAYADEFTLHKGVRFGMTIDDVIEQEANAGYTFRAGSETRVYNESIVPILNAENVGVYFTFDENGKLSEQQFIFSTYKYDFKSFRVTNLINESMAGAGEYAIFETLGTEYEKVYGKPNCSSRDGGALVLPTNISFRKTLFNSGVIGSDIARYILGDSIVSYEIAGKLKYPVSDVNYYQWLVECDGGYVVIEVYGYEYYSQFSGQEKTWIGSDYAVDYRFFTTEEYNALWNDFSSDI